MNTSSRWLGLYQFVGGLCTLVSLWTVMWSQGAVALVALAGLVTLALTAGVSMWRGGPARWWLSQANQLVQLVGLHTPWFVLAVVHGAGLTVALHYHPAATFAASEFNLTGALSLGSSTCDVLLGRAMVGPPVYGVSLNFLAAGVLLYLRVAASRARAQTVGVRAAPPISADE